MAERARTHDLMVWAARIAVAATFVVAALPKITDPAAFATDIANYRAFPYWSWNALAAVVPMLELVASVALLSGRGRRGAALVLAVLTVSFIVLIAWVIAADIDVSCGCFGAAPESPPVGWTELIRDVVLLGGIAIAGRATTASQLRDS